MPFGYIWHHAENEVLHKAIMYDILFALDTTFFGTEYQVKIIATDGMFSMVTETISLKGVYYMVEKHDAILFVDDANTTGLLIPTRRRYDEYRIVVDRIRLLLVSILRNTSRPYLFSNTLAPSVVGAAEAAINLVDNPVTRGPLLNQLWSNARLFRTRMSEAGFVLAGEGHAIIPVMLGDARLASKMAEKMLQRGIYVIGFSYPVVPKDKARIRVQLSAAHTTEQVNGAVDAFIEVGRELSVI